MGPFTVVLLLVVASTTLAVDILPTDKNRGGKDCAPFSAKAACTNVLHRAESLLAHREYEKYFDLFEEQAEYDVKGKNYKGRALLKYYAEMVSKHPVRHITFTLKNWEQSDNLRQAKCFLHHNSTLFSLNYNADYVYFLRQGEDCAYRVRRVEQH
ncbi:unnamed protein product [Caenorhabditis auriculariae]|uniref:DUF38 domain-containing protein n=1 Tax=Caenorhabditis auriculariae TaxID=2777116 RepID=A0A8S1HX45_9PELO|nr:unnamed protein product [Caenorhabditis auriculariae]